MFNNINKYVAKIVCVIMLLLVQFDVCAPLIDATPAIADVMEQTVPTSDNEEEQPGGEETYYFHSSRTQLPNIRSLACTIDTLINFFAVPQVLVQNYAPVSESLGKVMQHHIVFCVYRI